MRKDEKIKGELRSPSTKYLTLNRTLNFRKSFSFPRPNNPNIMIRKEGILPHIWSVETCLKGLHPTRICFFPLLKSIQFVTKSGMVSRLLKLPGFLLDNYASKCSPRILSEKEKQVSFSFRRNRSVFLTLLFPERVEKKHLTLSYPLWLSHFHERLELLEGEVILLVLVELLEVEEGSWW